MSPALKEFIEAFDYWRGLDEAAQKGGLEADEQEDYKSALLNMLGARDNLVPGFDFFDFLREIEKMNLRYELPCLEVPTLPQDLNERITKFKSILTEEINEADSIGEGSQVETLAEIADWLCDIIVYCASECRKYGIPTAMVLAIIMASNESKLGEDGRPIKDARGKFLKGPNYWRPEPRIAELLSEMRGEN